MASSYYANHNSVTSPYSLSARKSNSKYTLEEKSNAHGPNTAAAAAAASSSSVSSSSSSSNSILSSAGAASLSHSSSTSSNLANHSSSASTSSIPALVRRILEVAEKELFIDVRSEFYLLPIAMHALQSPQEWVRSPSSNPTGVETVEKQRPDLPWFRELVAQERSRFAKAPAENSPWIKIQDGDRVYWWNFSTMRRSNTSPFSHPHSQSSYSSDEHTAPADNKETMRPSKVEKAELDVMRFTSWWTENNRKRYVKVIYHMSAEEFEISIDQDEKIYRTRNIKTKTGHIATCWDLHLKACLDIFGRPTTLMSCDSGTRDWIETNARRLLAVRAMLEQKLSKYMKLSGTFASRYSDKTIPPTASACGRSVDIGGKRTIPLVEHHLRQIMKEVAKLKSTLAQFRPSLADEYQL